MSEPFMGEMRMVGFTFAPQGWALCEGQTMAIAQNQALFALLGTTYGGNGTTNFNLPDLRSRSPVGTGAGPGLTPIVQGELGGSESVTLLTQNLPAHNHVTTVQVAGAATSPLTAPSATNSVLGASGAGPGSASIWSTELTSPVPLSGVQSALTGSNVPAPARNPYLGVNIVIAMEGIFPSRP